ncbi:hypothetical protein Ciccas_014042 [Cichlidogyrus casuarinus]|uniref:Uncharacterized protein n=1 Tax=Cichlidogyrus casuarinus TaxID=1844966 RepID=A0ABD2PJ18_9PLAT
MEELDEIKHIYFAGDDEKAVRDAIRANGDKSPTIPNDSEKKETPAKKPSKKKSVRVAKKGSIVKPGDKKPIPKPVPETKSMSSFSDTTLNNELVAGLNKRVASLENFHLPFQIEKTFPGRR